MYRHTLVYNDAWDLFLSRGAASDAIAFHISIHLSQVFKGAVHASGELGNVMGFQDELESRKENINKMQLSLKFIHSVHL